MAIRIRGKAVEYEEVEFGVRFDDGFVHGCEDEDEAHLMAAMTDGQVVVREVYLTAWADLRKDRR